MSNIDDIKERLAELDEELYTSYASSSPLRKLLDLIRQVVAVLEPPISAGKLPISRAE